MFIAARNPTKIQHAKSVSFASALVRTGNPTKSNRDELVRYLDWMGRPRQKIGNLTIPPESLSIRSDQSSKRSIGEYGRC